MRGGDLKRFEVVQNGRRRHHMHWNRKHHSAGRLASGSHHPPTCWSQRWRRRSPRVLWGGLGIVSREATDKLRVRLILSPRTDCHIMERLQEIVLVIVAMTSRRASLVLARVHGGSGSSGTPHSRVPLSTRASKTMR